MLKRILLVVGFCAVLLFLPLPDAEAGTYVVRQCQHSAPTNETHEAAAGAAPVSGGYRLAAGPGICADAGSDYALGIEAPNPTHQGQYGQVRWTAPEGTSFVGVDVHARLRSEAGHRARLSMANAAGVETHRFGAGDPGPQNFVPYSWPASGNPSAPVFTATLICDNPAVGQCPTTDGGNQAVTQVRNVRLELRDTVAPTATLDSPMLEGGWHRGDGAVQLRAEDVGGGLQAALITVNGEPVASVAGQCNLIPGTQDARRLAPCSDSLTATKNLDTSQDPFDDGANQVLGCAVDLGTNPNLNCGRDVVYVDNTPPEAAFSGAARPN